MNELEKKEMADEELLKLVEEYRDENIKLASRLDVCKAHLAAALKNLAEGVA